MGTDGGTDTTTRPPHDLHLDLDVEAPDDALDRVVAGLRAGDLAFVVTATVCLGPAVAVGLAAAGVDPDEGRVADVAFALADLAERPATTSWSAGELLAAAVAEVAGS